jgi:multiple sugar transport system substrate-binding protein
VTLTYWSGFTGGDKQAYEDLIKKFNDTHPDIQVDYQLQPWDSIAQKLATAIISGSGPDPATPDYNVATIQQYVANGLALPLDALVGDGQMQVGKGVLPQTIVDSFSVGGKLYAAPAAASPRRPRN